MKEPKEPIDWVARLSSCSLHSVWDRLKLEIESDVAARRQQLIPMGVNYGFSITPLNDDVVVSLIGNAVLPRSIKISLTDDAIVVSDGTGKELFRATLTLDNDGECRFKINGAEREFWQMRQMALEELLFRGPIWRK